MKSILIILKSVISQRFIDNLLFLIGLLTTITFVAAIKDLSYFIIYELPTLHDNVNSENFIPEIKNYEAEALIEKKVTPNLGKDNKDHSEHFKIPVGLYLFISIIVLWLGGK